MKAVFHHGFASTTAKNLVSRGAFPSCNLLNLTGQVVRTRPTLQLGIPSLCFLCLFLPILGELTGEAVSAPRDARHFGGLRQDVGRNLVTQGSHATCRSTRKPMKTSGPEESYTFKVTLK